MAFCVEIGKIYINYQFNTVTILLGVQTCLPSGAIFLICIIADNH
jgi:hypothetical protein